MNEIGYYGIPVLNETIGVGTPTMYNHSNVTNSYSSPSTMHVRGTGLAQYFRRYLLQKAMSVFVWDMPDTWSREYFLYVLYCWGFVSIIKTDRYGVIPQACGLRGYDVFYRPTTAVITNPLLDGLKELQINRQCTLIRLQPDYNSIMDLVNYYSDMLTLCAEAIAVNLVNSKVSFVFSAENKAQAESFKALYDKITSGEPSVVVDKSLLARDGSLMWQYFQQNVGQNYIVDKLLSDMRKIENMFNTDIGIPNANTDKKERLITKEVEANNIETSSKCSLWLEELQLACKKTREMFDTKISVDWREPPETKESVKEGVKNAT